MKPSEVIEEFMREIKTFEALDRMTGMPPDERSIWIQTVFLRAACRLFDANEKAQFARMAKINWDVGYADWTPHGGRTIVTPLWGPSWQLPHGSGLLRIRSAERRLHTEDFWIRNEGRQSPLFRFG
jgi:hypothetical protein